MIRMVLTAAVLLLAPVPSAQAEEDGDFAALKARQLYVAKDYTAAFAVALPLAEAGVPRAQTLVGVMYDLGLGTAADPAKALQWYEKAAAQGFPQAFHNLGNVHDRGELGVPEDDVMARDYYSRAVAQDFGPSFGNLAIMLREGEGGPVDMELAVALLERGIALQDAQSTAELAFMLAVGKGVPVDMVRARTLYKRAAAQGVDWAARDYGEMLELAEGGATDLPTALDYYKQAAALGNAEAGFDIIEMAAANPDAFADKVEPLAWCFWAEAQPPMGNGADFDGKCAAFLDGYGADEIARARAMAADL
ncbi:MAG: tetratricopeptide repeat protein [Rhodobacterales bacterium]|nr:tetratricopeptide repeat protein [Rhodobacterales bacterium]